MSKLFLKFTLACLFVTLAGSLFAQTVTGGINGVVTDQTEAVISNAKVVAHNLATGVDTETVTNSAGVYRLQFLPIGQYEIKITAQGFSPANVPAFSLEALQTAVFNIKLSVTGQTTTVNVSEAAPILNLDNPTLAGTFTATTLETQPLNGLDFASMTLYVPGAVNTYGTSGMQSTERNTVWSDSVNMNGNREQANNYTLEGIDINESFNNDIA